MLDLGTVRPGSTVRIPFSSFDKDDGSSITMTNYAAADILVYKDGGTTERASTAGFTATTDFDTKTGKHLAVIDLSDNTTSGFWNAGSEYLVAIDAVTVDAVTTGGWIARFVIGYPNAVLNTTIATLSSQTSFTLTAGPAEDNALVGMWAIIHDIASAVQFSKVLITGYTGSTKTITLSAGATFTAAAGDNFSVIDLAPLQATTTGRTLDVSSTGEAGIDWANIGSPTTAVNLSATNIDVDQVVASVSGAVGSVTGAVGSVTGNVGGNVTGSVGSVATGGITSGSFAAGAINAAAIAADAIGASELAADAVAEIADAVWDEARAGHVAAGSFGEGVASVQGNVTGSVASVTGAVGSVTGNVGGNVTGSVGSVTGLTNASIADAVWDEARSGHVTAGSFGEGVASVQGNVTGSVGSVTGAVGSVTGAVGSVTGNVGGNVVGSVGSVTGAVGSVTAGVTVTTNNDKTGYRLSATGVDDIWDEATSGHTTAGTTGKALTDAGSAGDPWSTAVPGAYAAGTAGYLIGTYVDAPISTVDTVVDAIKAKTDNLPATPAATGDAMTLTSAYDFAKGTAAMTESYATDGAAMTPAQALHQIWSLLAEKNIASTTLTAKKLDGSTTAMTFTLDDATNPTSITRAS